MNGEIDFSKSLSKRLEILNINRDAIREGIEIIKNKISASFTNNIDFIKSNSENIYIISGGFIDFIKPIANMFNIKPNHIFCNSFIKDDDSYILDKNNIMSQDLAKIQAIKQLKLNGTIVVIGDGYTDYEIKKYGYANIFIAYTEHVERKKVVEFADHTSNSFDDIINYLDNLRNS